MTKGQKVGLVLLIIITLVYIKLAFFSNIQRETTVVEETITTVEPEKTETEEVALKSYVNVYFIGQNENKEEVYKIVRRPYDPKADGTKIKASIKNLLAGPSKEERAKGVYSEIPQGTKLVSIEEKPDKIIVNLSSEFEQGGGTDGLYKRLYQLIKTSNRNTATDVYLYLNGKKAEVIGGEGIMINQPLNAKSLDD